MTNSKFSIGDIVIFSGGLFRIKKVHISDITITYDLGSFTNISESQLKKADWRDKVRILGKRNTF